MSQPREIRLPMCAWSVSRCRAGRKTVTRRLKNSDRPPCHPGDTLVLTCVWGVDWVMDKMPPRDMIDPAWFWSLWSDKRPATKGRTRQARFVPRVLYRRFPQVKCLSVKAIRLQDISHEDALREGAGSIPEYMSVWDSLHRNQGWTVNPQVWRIEFEPVKGLEKGAPC